MPFWKIVTALVQILASLMKWLNDRQLIRAGEARQKAGSLQKQYEKIEKALSARRRARARGLPEHDPNRRD